jgi:hypothetical protein
MAVKSTRGEKRRCQSEDCAASFYDLNRDTFACPNCGTAFDVEADRAAKEALHASSGFPSRKKPRVLPITAPGKASSGEDDNDDETTVDDADEVAETSTDDSDTDEDKIILDNDDDDDALADAVPLAEADNDDSR